VAVVPPSVVHVHHRGDRGVDGILRLIELASHDGPLEATLGAMCDEVAAIAEVDIASVYVREGDRLVMRGNHGFPKAAIGAVSLAVGEGITGLVAECMRPVSAAHAAAEAAYKHVPGLGEERFPVFAGVPLIGGGAVIGVLVLQRQAGAFSADEVTLATALGAPVTLAIERRRAAEIRSARLHGLPHVGGAVLGRAAVVATTTALGSAPLELDPSPTPPASDLGAFYRYLPGIDMSEYHNYFHTDWETAETVPWTGLEASTRAFAKIIDEVNKLPLSALKRPEEPAPPPRRPTPPPESSAPAAK